MEVNASRVNFAAGVLSRKLLARTDLPVFYNAGVIVGRNFIPQAQGPAEYRSGSRYVMPTRLNKFAAQYPFVFNDAQAYALSFTDQKLRFFSDGGVIFGNADEEIFKFLSHFDGSDGATSYTAETGQPLTFFDDAQLDTAQKKFGTASLLLDGTGDYIKSGDSEAANFGTGDFTVDFHVRFNNTSGVQSLFSSGDGGQVFRVYLDTGTIYVSNDLSSGTLIAYAWTPAAATDYHIAVTRSGSNIRLFIDGVQVSTTGDDSTNYSPSGGIFVGRQSNAASQYFNGWIDEIAIRHTAVWVSDFVAPTSAYGTTGMSAITDITQASPGVVTIGSHGYTGGEQIFISEVEGMTEINNKFYLVVFIGANTFSLTDLDGNAINTSGFTAYTSLGLSEQVYEIDTPYLEDDLRGLKFAQKADLMYIVHPNYEPRKLIRSGDASWALSTYTRTSDPFTKVITGATKASPGVITATAHGFSNDDLVEIYDVGGMTEINGNTYKVAGKNANDFQLTDSVTGEDIDTSGFGAYTSGGYVFKKANMPNAVAFYGGRLFFAGTLDEPESFWGSKAPTNAGVVQYDDFTVGSSEDDAVTFPISSQNNTADIIQWLAGVNKFLGLGAYGGVYKANGGSDASPISGTAIAVQAIDASGCQNLAPVRMGDRLFYVQRGGLVLNRFGFSILADDYKSDNLNIFSDEITKTGIIQLATQQGDADIIWAIAADNRLLGLTIKSDEDISAWHDHILGGTDVKVLSVSGEPKSDNRDSLWIVVERTVNSVTRRYIEYRSAESVLPEREDFFTGDKDVDDLTYRALLYETARNLVRVDSSLTLDQSQSIGLTPGAVTGSGVTFTSVAPLFAATDVGRKIAKKIINGTETGIAEITAFTSTTEVVCTILEDFDSTDLMDSSNWFLSVTAISGLDHLEGETVQIQIDGANGGTVVVSSGAITLDGYGFIIHVGLAYTGRLQLMPLDIGALVGTAQARTMTVNKLGLLIRHTQGIKYGTDLYNLQQLPGRSSNEHFDRPPALITDAVEVFIPDGYTERKIIHIVQDEPFPCTVQGVVPFVDTTSE